MVANGTSPEELRRMVMAATGARGETADGARTFGLPKWGLKQDADPRLREPLMSKDKIQAAWGWYSGRLDEPAVLPPEVIEQYRDHGHIVLRGFFDPRQIQELLPLVRDTTSEHSDEWHKWLSGRLKTDKEPDTKQFIRIFNLLEKEPRLAPLLHSPRLANAAKQLEDMAGGVRFYQAQSFYKEPGDTGSLWHSDSYACPLDTNNQLTTAWVPMVEVEREMGVLAFARGSHQDMNLNFWNDGNAMAHTDDAQAATGELGVYAAKHVKSRYHVDVWPRLKPGDVTFHGGWTLHASFKVRRHLCTRCADVSDRRWLAAELGREDARGGGCVLRAGLRPHAADASVRAALRGRRSPERCAAEAQG